MSKKKKKSQPVIPKAEKTNIIGTITAKEIRTMQTKVFVQLHGIGPHGTNGYNRRKEKKKVLQEIKESKDSYFYVKILYPHSVKFCVFIQELFAFSFKNFFQKFLQKILGKNFVEKLQKSSPKFYSYCFRLSVAHFYKLEFPLLHSNRESLGISAALRLALTAYDHLFFMLIRRGVSIRRMRGERSFLLLNPYSIELRVLKD